VVNLHYVNNVMMLPIIALKSYQEQVSASRTYYLQAALARLVPGPSNWAHFQCQSSFHCQILIFGGPKSICPQSSKLDVIFGRHV
jgi:hypothetical protein